MEQCTGERFSSIRVSVFCIEKKKKGIYENEETIICNADEYGACPVCFHRLRQQGDK
jgi:hypothetical protein